MVWFFKLVYFSRWCLLGAYEYKTLTLEQTIAKFNDANVSLSTTQADIAGFSSPKRAVGDAYGNVFVLDSVSLRKFNAAGDYIKGYGIVKSNGNFGSGKGSLFNGDFTPYTNFTQSKYFSGDPQLAIKGGKIYLFTAFVDENGSYNRKTYVHSYTTSDMTHVKSFEVSYGPRNRGITVLADGSMWLAYQYRIVHYSAEGTLLKTIGITNSDGTYISGSEKEQFNDIYGIASDASEHIYVSDYRNSRIQVFSKTGTFIKNINLSFQPTYMAISPITDAIWVSGTYYGHGLIRLNSNGKMDFTFFSDSSQYLYDYVRGIGFDNTGKLLLTNLNKNTFNKYNIGTATSPTEIAPVVTMDLSVDSANTISVNAHAYDEDGYIASYSWDFGDSSTAGTTASLSHTYAATGTYTVTCTVTDNSGSSTVLKQSVMISALSTGSTSTTTGQTQNIPLYTYTQDDLDSAKADQIATCKNDPSNCGITVSHDTTLDISATKIDALGTGWTLLGTSTEITDMSMFNNVTSVWIQNGTSWKAYSPNSTIASTIASKSIDTFTSIPASSGFWVQK